MDCSLCLNFFHLLAQKPNLVKKKKKKKSIYSNKCFNNFHLCEYSFTCPRLRASGLAWRLGLSCFNCNRGFNSVRVDWGGNWGCESCVCGLFLEEFIMHSHCMYCDGEGVSPNFCAISIVIAYYFVGKIRHL